MMKFGLFEVSSLDAASNPLLRRRRRGPSRSHVRTVRNYVRDGRLPAVRIGKQYRIPKDAVDELIGNDAQSAAVRRVEVMAILAIDNVDAPPCRG